MSRISDYTLREPVSFDVASHKYMQSNNYHGSLIGLHVEIIKYSLFLTKPRVL